MKGTLRQDSQPSRGKILLDTSYGEGCLSLPIATIDFETRSECELRKHGAWRYSKHPSTEVLCMAYQIEDRPTKLWIRYHPLPADLGQHIAHGGLIEAHNYFFEKCLWEHVMRPKYYWPWIPELNWRCSAALAARRNLPRSLDGACSALNLPVQKDKAGHRLMRKICKLRKATKDNDAKWHEEPEDLKRLYEYCKQDVKAEYALSRALGELEPRELAIWQFTEALNWRGVYLDLDFAQRAIDIFGTVEKEGHVRVSEITNGEVTTLGQRDRILTYCESQGVELDNLQGPTVAEALLGELPENVRAVLDLRRKLSKGTSISKYKAMLARADLGDNRLRDHVRYFAAGPGRWAGQGVQTQNLPRKVKLSRARPFIKIAKELKRPQAIRLLYDNVPQELSSCVRPTFRAAPGHNFVCVDFAAIEARVLAWLTRDHNLELFKQGKDIYIEMASKIYKRKITKEDTAERNLGKATELACGYQLWWRTLLTRCWQQGIKIDPSLALQTVKLYRKSHPLIKQFWYDIEQTFLDCILYRKPVQLGHLGFEMAGENAHIVFPSGRYIVYNKVSVKKKVRKAGKVDSLRQQLKQLGATKETIDEACDLFLDETKDQKNKAKQVPCYYHEDSMRRKWLETTTYGGKLTENVCQGIAGDALTDASLKVAQRPELYGHVVMTVHDELVMEQKKGCEHLQMMIQDMCRASRWAKGLPLDGEGWVGEEYRK